MPNNIDEFWNRVKKGNDCWEWLGGKDRDGYGRYNLTVSYENLSKKWYGAHRLSYTLTKGNIPKGKVICHSCDNPGCVNPDHLWVGTQQDNVRDMDQKNRRVKPFTLKAKKNPPNISSIRGVGESKCQNT